MPPAAKKGDQVVAVDIHMIQPPGPTSPVPVPHPYNGLIDGSLSSDVNIMGMPAATVNSTSHGLSSDIRRIRSSLVSTSGLDQ